MGSPRLSAELIGRVLNFFHDKKTLSNFAADSEEVIAGVFTVGRDPLSTHRRDCSP